MSCAECFSGTIHTGTPKGQVAKVHGFDTYVAEPSGAIRGIIVIIPDAFGWEFVNLRLLADAYAEHGGYKVYLPEFMNGVAAPAYAADLFRRVLTDNSYVAILLKPYYLVRMLWVMVPFFIRARFSVTWPRVKTFFGAVRENEGADLPIGASGFCWGGKHTVNLAHGHKAPNGKPLIDAAFTAHPSNLEIPKEIEQIKAPVSFAIGDKDMLIKAPQIDQIQRILESQSDEFKGEIKVYPGAGHGFGARADHVLVDASRQAEESQEQALHWFHRQFLGTS